MVRAIPDRDREQYCDVGSSLLIKIVVCSSLLLAIFHLHLRSRFENQSLPVISAAGGGANQPAAVFSNPINPTLLRASDGSLWPPLMKIKTAEGMSASGIMWKCQMSCARLSTHRTWYASTSPAPLQAQLHLLALDDTPRPIPPEEHSVFSREDALGPTDGARLRVPQATRSARMLLPPSRASSKPTRRGRPHRCALPSPPAATPTRDLPRCLEPLPSVHRRHANA